MMISEGMKRSYDVIGQKVGNRVVVVHEGKISGMRVSYDSLDEFNRDARDKGIKVLVLESING